MPRARGLAASGRPSRPVDGSDRLAALAAAFGQEFKPEVSPPFRPACARGGRAVVGGEIEVLDPRLRPFPVDVARDVGLAFEFQFWALGHPQPPVRTASTGSHEAVRRVAAGAPPETTRAPLGRSRRDVRRRIAAVRASP